MGLSGSSAIIIAAFKCLLKFYGLTIADLKIPKDGSYFAGCDLSFVDLLCEQYLCTTEFPAVILDIERVELGISAGLQDRVIQTYGGLVHMDFTDQPAEPVDGPRSRYSPLDPALLPHMYLAYDACAGEADYCNSP